MDDVKLAPMVIGNRLVEGFATNVEASADRSEADLARQLRQVSQDLGAGIPGDQSAAGDLLRKIIARIRGRKLVEDLGLHPLEIPWLSLHVPTRGKARLQLTSAEKGADGIKFSLAGTGFGDGWSFAANLRQDFQERTRCLALVELFQVRLRSYAYADSPHDLEYRSDVVAQVGTGARELARCPLCQPSPNDPPVFARKAGPAIDLIADSIGQTLSQQMVLTGTSEFEIGLKAKLPGDLALSAGVTCKREVSFTCTVDYTLAGRRRYQAMRQLQFPDLPFWQVEAPSCSTN
jgi:hypothetical protein